MSCHSASSHEGSEMDAPQVSYMDRRLTPTSSVPEGENEADHGPLDLPNERRRNRLGYHRSTVACGHCRKRKIRCKKPEVKDLLNRCESCINLKKPCVYAAVNPQAPPHTITHRPRRMSIGSNPTSPSTSPGMVMGHIVEGQSNPTYHQLTAMPSMPNIGQQPVEAGEDETYSIRIPSTTPSSRSFSYGQVASGWMSTDADASAETAPGATNTPWTTFPHDVPETTGFSQYASHVSTWPTNSLGINRMDTETHLDDTWRPYPSGARSMSFNSHQSGQFDSSSTRPYDRVQSPSATDIMPEASLVAQGSLSAGATPHLAYDVWQQQYQYPRPNEDYGGWYENGDHAAGAHVSSNEDPSQVRDVYYSQR
ncbi:hypothetical protein F5Y00DRAFT_271107 [Daldinia vernicosa]|uniref:uncharacterized protein n=1 Tax=Daldinia vernicosa TaxID=114800 RepID=UPI002007AC15|nr:uncharacterized protein F5Y00DRAFT_271107 [Daldinia vernicosa]KAI0847600.1 hypothetical protein F5Y00DRAFT_271107 [Daldinia vernicosa]